MQKSNNTCQIVSAVACACFVLVNFVMETLSASESSSIVVPKTVRSSSVSKSDWNILLSLKEYIRCCLLKEYERILLKHILGQLLGCLSHSPLLQVSSCHTSPHPSRHLLVKNSQCQSAKPTKCQCTNTHTQFGHIEITSSQSLYLNFSTCKSNSIKSKTFKNSYFITGSPSHGPNHV